MHNSINDYDYYQKKRVHIRVKMYMVHKSSMNRRLFGRKCVKIPE